MLVIATLDGCHVAQCEKALALGYDVLLKKPITDSKEECDRLLAAHKKYGGKIVVCHVLRYAPAYIKLKEVLDGGSCGSVRACFGRGYHSQKEKRLIIFSQKLADIQKQNVCKN